MQNSPPPTHFSAKPVLPPDSEYEWRFSYQFSARPANAPFKLIFGISLLVLSVVVASSAL